MAIPAASLLLALSVVAVGLVGWRGLEGERAALRETARAELAAQLEAARAEIRTSRAEALASPPRLVLDRDGRRLFPPPGRPLPDLEEAARTDPEGAFYLEQADRTRVSEPERARQLLRTAALARRRPPVRLLALLRLLPLLPAPATGESGEARGSASMLSTRRGVRRALRELLEEEGTRPWLRTREATLARLRLGGDEALSRTRADTRSSAGASPPPPLSVLVETLGGPDAPYARALLAGEGLLEHPLVLAREAELHELARLNPLRERIRSTPGGGARTPDGLVVWTTLESGRRSVHRAAWPRLPAGVHLVRNASPPTLEDETRQRALLSGFDIALEARLPEGWLERREGRRRAALIGLLGASLAALAAATWLGWRSVRHERAQRRAAAVFLAQVGHDLRTPLAAIRLWAETLSGGRVRNEVEAAECARIIAGEAQAVGDLAEKALELARLDGAPARCEEALDPGRLLREVATVRAPLFARGGCDLRLSGDDEGLEVRGDEIALRAVVGNLLDNALLHGGTGGEIEAEVRRDAGSIVLRIADRGPGWPPDRERLLARFAKGPGARGRGTGLGLALVREVVAAHGGQLLLLDREGGGAEVRIALPAERRRG